MRNLFFALIACITLVGCKTDQGASFIGQWKHTDKVSETITVSKVNGGYRVVSKLDNPDMEFLDMDITLVPESDEVLVTLDRSKKVLELASNGTITSHLRTKEKTFVKVN